MSTNDPFDRARAALEAAREARGASDEEEVVAPTVDPGDPYSAAEAALRKAEEARKAAQAPRREAEDRARRELERLKALASGATAATREVEAEEGEVDADDVVTEPRVRPRRL